MLDVFLYNGETDMLNLRVATLAEHVDAMVAVVCDLTHQSEPNPLPPIGSIPAGVELVCVPAKLIPEGRGGSGTPYYQWVERQHRDGMIEAVADYDAGRVVMISDVDEIPDPASLPEIEEAASRDVVAVPMRMHGFALNYLHPLRWVGTTASRVDALAPQAHRSWRHRVPGVGNGWHLSWFGDMEEKRRKLRSFSHAELHDLDVDDCYRTGVHANGERMTHLSRDVVEDMDWPAPLFGGFDIPPSWWAPEDR